MSNDVEVWKIIDGCEDYAVSNLGRVKNLMSGKVLKGSLRQGYVVHTIRTNKGKPYTINTHILVAKAFVYNDNSKKKKIVNHKDEDKTNPKADNLEWTTNRQNSRYGTSPLRIGLSKEKPLNEYDINGKYIRTWKASKYIENIYPITARNVQKSIEMGNRTAYGRQWRYLIGDDRSDIEPITNKYVLKYLPNDDYNYDIPEEYLYTVKKLEGAELLADKIDEMIHSSDMPLYFIGDLKAVKEYLLKQCC